MGNQSRKEIRKERQAFWPQVFLCCRSIGSGILCRAHDHAWNTEWFGSIDEIWQFGKPQGWGGPWWKENVKAGDVSDPFLMTGFDKKVVHIGHDADKTVRFTVEVDFLGNGTWKTYENIPVDAGGYAHHVFPSGFSAHWVRVRVDTGCRVTVYFVYT